MSELTELERAMLTAACGTPFAAVQMLAGLGADRRFIARLCGQGDLATVGVELSRDGSSFDMGGPTRRLLLAVRDEWGEVIDIAALSSTVRDEWALLIGDGWALGLDCLDRAQDHAVRAIGEAGPGRKVRGTVLRVYSTPLDWLAHGGDGICVLDWSARALTELRSLGEGVTLVVDPGAQERLKALLAYGALPRVSAAAVGAGLAA